MKVYIAGPIAKGPRGQNIRNAIDAGQAVLESGHAPFIPHLNQLWDIVHPGTGEQWLAWDFEWLMVCDALIRLPGESAGSDEEVALAESLGIPVFLGLDDFLGSLDE